MQESGAFELLPGDINYVMCSQGRASGWGVPGQIVEPLQGFSKFCV
jgi:hypothetical protein